MASGHESGGTWVPARDCPVSHPDGAYGWRNSGSGHDHYEKVPARHEGYQIVDGDENVIRDVPARSDLAGQLEGWWHDQANLEVEQVVPKAVEYGGKGRAVDLVDIGKDLLRAQGVEEDQITDEWATELGIYFYIRGKVSRWTAAMIAGERVSDDTLHDISVYCRMAQRVRAVGGWPF